MLQITILWYSVFTFLCAFAQNFEQLFILRALHGLGFGGEWAAGAVLMGEVIRDKYRGRGVGLVQTGWAVGWGASALVYTALYWFLPEAIAWRILFAIGLVPAAFVFWIRRHIEESEVFDAHRETAAPVGFSHLFSAFRGPHLWTTVKVSLMVAGAQGGGYALGIWMPAYLREVHHLSAPSTGGFLLMQILGALIGFLLGAYLSDAIGRRGTFVWSAIVVPRRAALHRADAKVSADGSVHDRIVSDRGAGHGAGFLLQRGPRDRVPVPQSGRLFCRQRRAWRRDRHSERGRVRPDDPDAAAIARNPRPQPRPARTRAASAAGDEPDRLKRPRPALYRERCFLPVSSRRYIGAKRMNIRPEFS
jgi:hypothetical protein